MHVWDEYVCLYKVYVSQSTAHHSQPQQNETPRTASDGGREYMDA